MAEYITESAAQMVSRIHSKLRPSLAKLAPEIIPAHGPHPSEIIEIRGESNVGKTIMLLELIAKAVIPIEHGGRSATVILIDLTSNFCIQNMLPILEKHILHHRLQMDNSTETEALRSAITKDVQEVIELALNNLQLIQCYASEEFDRALFRIATPKVLHPNVSMLAIESLGAYYWNDVSSDRPLRMDSYMKNLLKAVRKITDDHGIVLAYTRPALFPVVFEPSRQEKVDYMVALRAVGEDDVFHATVLVNDVPFVRKYAIKGFGIQWE